MTTSASTTSDNRVGVRELKTRLSHYLHRVKGGQTVVVTERGRAVARLVPATDRIVPAAVQRLLSSGTAAWSGEELPDFTPVPATPRAKRAPTIAQTVFQDRR